MTQAVSAVVIGPDRETVITFNLYLYNRAPQIQQTSENTNWIVRAGILHIVIAALHAIGKTIDGRGFDTCAIKKCIYTPWQPYMEFMAKHCKRGIKYHHNQPSNHGGAIWCKRKRGFV